MNGRPAWLWEREGETRSHPWIDRLHGHELDAYAHLLMLWECDAPTREHFHAVLERIERVREAHAALERDLWMDAVRALGRGLRRIGAALEPREENAVEAIRARLAKGGG